MTHIPYIFNQLTAHLPKDTFDRLVKKYNGNAYIKNFSCWNHLLVMIWSQLTARHSLRDIETSLRAHSDKMYRMGFGRNISRNNLANANSKRDVAIYREMAQVMMLKASGIKRKDDILSLIAEVFNLNGFFAIDSSTVTLDLKKFNWSIPQKDRGGIKLHTMYDLLRSVPRLCLVSGHEERDQTFMEDYPYEQGCFYMFDKMYVKALGLYRVETAKAFFVTRMKKKMVYEVVEQHPVDGVYILADKTITFTSRFTKKGYPSRLRLISFYNDQKNQTIVFITNNFKLDPATIALLYRYRWQIELFFRWIKQHLRINFFYGTSANAVMIQIYTAFVSFCILALAADAISYKGTLYEFSNIMSVSLTEKEWLTNLLQRYEKQVSRKPVDTQLALFDF